MVRVTCSQGPLRKVHIIEGGAINRVSNFIIIIINPFFGGGGGCSFFISGVSNSPGVSLTS